MPRGIKIGLACVLLTIVGLPLLWLALCLRPDRTDYVAERNALLQAEQPQGADGWPLWLAIYRDEIGLRKGGRPLVSESEEELLLALHAVRNAQLTLGGADDDAGMMYRAVFPTIAARLLPLLDEACAAPAFARPSVYAGDAISGDLGSPQHDRPFAEDQIISESGAMGLLHSLNIAAMRLAAAQGQWDDCAARFRTGLRLARQRSLLPSMFDLGTSQRLWDYYCAQLRLVLLEHEPPAGVCREFGSILDEHPWPASRDDFALDAWRIDVLERTSVWLDRSEERRIGEYLGMPHPARARRMIDERMPELRAAWSTGVAPPGSSSDVDKWTGKVYIDIAVQLLFKSRRRMITTRTHAAATRLMLALAIHHAQTGRWPDTLADSSIDPALHMDPVSGDAFEYMRTPDDAHARPYLLPRAATATHIDKPRAQNDQSDPFIMNPPREPLPAMVRR